MADKEDWLFRPVLRGLIKGESLFDGTLSLGQVALFNEAVTVELENQVRQHRALKKAEAR